MTCGLLASTVTRTCKLVEPAAKMQVNLDNKEATIDNTGERKRFEDALAEGG